MNKLWMLTLLVDLYAIYSARINKLRMCEGFARFGYWFRLRGHNALYTVLAVVAFSAVGRCVSVGFEPFSWQQKPRGKSNYR